MTIFLKHWHFSPEILVFIAAISIVHFYINERRLNKSIWIFLTAIFLIVICNFSPLSWLGMHALFSVHMICHVFSFLVVPPLLILSLSKSRKKGKHLFLNKLSKLAASMPWFCWLIGVGIMWFWHIPSIFDGAMAAHGWEGYGLLHHFQSISLMLVGLLFWWPVMGPIQEYRLPHLKGVLFLFTACISCSLLGLLITFSPVGLYTHYLTVGAAGVSSFSIGTRTITTKMDRQIAGLIMWVPGCIIYLSAALYLLQDWFKQKDIPKESVKQSGFLNSNAKNIVSNTG